jgi:hypothetical protein
MSNNTTHRRIATSWFPWPDEVERLARPQRLGFGGRAGGDGEWRPAEVQRVGVADPGRLPRVVDRGECVAHSGKGSGHP